MSFLEANGKSLNQKYSNASSQAWKCSSTHIMTTLCLGKKMIKASVKKINVLQHTNFFKTKVFTRNWKSFPQSNYIIGTPSQKAAFSL